MSVTNLYTIDGQIIGYKDAGGRKDFLTDNLGSVTAEIDQTGNTRSFDGRYKPYGETLSSTGARGLFGWIGGKGYRETGLASSSHYVRARHYSKLSGDWTTTDRLWPTELAYNYTKGRCMKFSDPSGLQVGFLSTCKWFVKWINDCNSCCNKERSIGKYDYDESFSVCFPGGKCACLSPQSSQFYPSYRKCLQAHEESHIKDYNEDNLRCRQDENGCGSIGPIAGDEPRDNNSECKAFVAELNCARQNFPNPCPGSTDEEITICGIIQGACKILNGDQDYPNIGDGSLNCKRFMTKEISKYCTEINKY